MNDIMPKEASEILRHYTDLGYGIVIEGDDVSKIIQALSLASKTLANGTPYNPTGDCISRSAVEKIVGEEFVDLQDGTDEWRTRVNDTCENILTKVHNAPTVKFSLLPADESKEEAYMRGYKHGKIEGIIKGMAIAEKSQGKCKTCIHRDPEDKKCDCGALERQGCPFPVSDDYFCKFYEKGGAEE